MLCMGWHGVDGWCLPPSPFSPHPLPFAWRYSDDQSYIIDQLLVAMLAVPSHIKLLKNEESKVRGDRHGSGTVVHNATGNHSTQSVHAHSIWNYRQNVSNFVSQNE